MDLGGHPLDGKRPPVLFETMVKFRGAPRQLVAPSWLYLQRRYATWKQADDGHERACLFVRHNYETLRKSVGADAAQDDPHEEN
jgi:hypothetical protein